MMVLSLLFESEIVDANAIVLINGVTADDMPALQRVSQQKTHNLAGEEALLFQTRNVYFCTL